MGYHHCQSWGLFKISPSSIYILPQHPSTSKPILLKHPKIMKIPIILSLLLFLLPSSTPSTLPLTCESIARSRPDIPYDFCVSSLESDPSTTSTSNPNSTTMAVAASNLSVANATAILSKIASIAAASPGPALGECLSTCSDVYSDAIDDLNSAISSLKEGGYENAQTYLSAALDASGNCEDAFGEEGVASPVEEEDEVYGRLACIALAITASLR